MTTPRCKTKPISGRLIAVSLTVLVIVNAVALRDYWPKFEKRYLIIHADDAGMNENVNAATIDAMERGVVTSASIMTPCRAFEQFARYCAAHPERDFGVHLTLTCELKDSRWGPVSSSEDVPSLVDKDGKFWRTVAEVAKYSKIDEVERELRAQIELARSAGISISHLDHHMFVLCARPDLLNLYVNLGVEYGVPVRIQESPPSEDIIDGGKMMIDAFEASREFVAEHNLRILNYLETDNYFVPPEQKLQYYVSQLQELPPGVSEFVVHCAYIRPGGGTTPDVERRMADTQVFLSERFKEELDRHDIILTNHGQLRNSR